MAESLGACVLCCQGTTFNTHPSVLEAAVLKDVVCSASVGLGSSAMSNAKTIASNVGRSFGYVASSIAHPQPRAQSFRVLSRSHSGERR
jgi:hypothetical protein